MVSSLGSFFVLIFMSAHSVIRPLARDSPWEEPGSRQRMSYMGLPELFTPSSRFWNGGSFTQLAPVKYITTWDSVQALFARLMTSGRISFSTRVCVADASNAPPFFRTT